MSVPSSNILTFDKHTCFFTLAVPNNFRYPVWGQEPGSLTHKHCRVLTQKLTFSPTCYYEVGTSGNALKAILFQLVYRSNIYKSVCIFLYIKLQSEL